MLLQHGLLGERGEVVVLQPRRLATRMLAKRVAEELGTPLGETVGYQIRLESRVSERTRIRFVTEGILLRQMSFDPTLRGVSAIVFDEFHERHLYGDISLARALQIQQSTRPDLKIIVMSATLEAGLLRNYLAPCEVLVSQGRSFPVRIEYLPKPVNFDDEPVWDVAARRVRARRRGKSIRATCSSSCPARTRSAARCRRSRGEGVARLRDVSAARRTAARRAGPRRGALRSDARSSSRPTSPRPR